MKSPEYQFDTMGADLACAFFERLLHHSKGEWAGKPFRLLDWQRDKVVRPLFGWKRADGTRRYRRAYIEVPRKNGKTVLAAGLALYMLYADGEPGAEVYSAAVDREQASLVFDEAKAMVQMCPQFAKISEVYRKAITVPGTRSSYRVLSADVKGSHGVNASAVIFDELHAQPTRELWDVLNTSTGARRQPLVVAITTAGYDRESICWEQHEYARQVRDGIIEDDSFLPVLYGAEDGDDWLDEAVWHKANPSLGQTIKLEYLQREAERARVTPAYQNTFRRLHLNQWTAQESRWLPMEAWERCADPFDEELLDGAECYGGLDLASTSDIASLVLCFPSEPGEPELYTWLARFWIPAQNIIERARQHRVPYDAWVRDGLVVATPGNMIDYAYIAREIEALSERYNIREIAFDRWGAFQLSAALQGAGLTMIGFGQGYMSMAAPTKELLRLVLDSKLRHGGNPVLRWMADNLIVDQDAAGNVKPNKAKSREKIDGIVAGIMALDRAMRHAGRASDENLVTIW